ncbi:MAG: aminopeptidase [Flavobacteriales bacterium]|nr:aminopeptidase [Flavobacteriales bacterium]
MKKLIIVALTFSTSCLFAQEQDTITSKDTLSFEKIVQWDANPVESQGQTGTCWSFSTSSFLESEIIRTKKEAHNLSEIFVARQVYIRKAENFVGRHGKAQFGEGSLGHDLFNAIDKYGIVPTEVFDGLQLDSEKHDHTELANILEAFLKAIIQNKGKKLTPVWMDAYSALLDVYLGNFPKEFDYQGKTYTPKSFAASLGIDKENYITICSYTHYPFYSKFILDIPDNWDNGFFYNVQLKELVTTTKKALNDGYTIEWDADVSNEGFNSKKGLAIVPLEDEDPNFITDEEEMEVTQKNRQENFENYTVTDDHLMHIVGLAKGVNGQEYFIVKNSWGDEKGMDDFKGHILVSEAYFKMNTISIMLHKDAVGNSLKKKLDL